MRLHRRRLSVRTKPCQSTPCIIEPPPGAVSSNKPVKHLDRMNTSRGKLLTQISGNSIKFPQGVAPSGQQSLWPPSALTLILLYFKTLPTVYTTLYMVQEDHKVWGHEEVLLVFLLGCHHTFFIMVSHGLMFFGLRPLDPLLYPSAASLWVPIVASGCWIFLVV